MSASAWFQLLVNNRLRVSPSRIPLAATISVASLGNSLLALVQRLLYQRKINRSLMPADPLFILGHWRSGTTLLHRLLTLDSRHSFPSTYACFAPSHFLVSEKLLTPLLRLLVPARRPQDNVPVRLQDPQEDEWALCCLGQPSPYLAAAFPNDLPHAGAYFDFAGISESEAAQWQAAWCHFLKAVQLRTPGTRLVLKSPLHTARLQMVLSVFPRARFVHVVRDPHEVYVSTVRLWQRLCEDEGLQIPDGHGLEEFVLHSYERMYRSFRKDRHRIPAGHLCQVRYEQLVNDPVTTLQLIYERLDLGDFQRIEPIVKSFAADQSSFQTNQYQPNGRHLARIDRWYDLIDDDTEYRRTG
jgi:hypothetical protein